MRGCSLSSPMPIILSFKKAISFPQTGTSSKSLILTISNSSSYSTGDVTTEKSTEPLLSAFIAAGVVELFILMRISGNFLWNISRTGSNTSDRAVSVVPIETMPPLSSFCIRSSFSPASICKMAGTIWEYRVSPSGVNLTPRLVLLNSTHPSVFSRFLTDLDILGWLLSSSTAALVKFWYFAT